MKSQTPGVWTFRRISAVLLASGVLALSVFSLRGPSLSGAAQRVVQQARREHHRRRLLRVQDDDGVSKAPYLERLGRFQTHLTRQGPAPQQRPPESPPPGLREVRYRSGNLSLLAWLFVPPGKGPHPAVMFCHGGYMLNASNVAAAQPFMDAGYAVLFPAWRGENGNPGSHELLRGEVEDAASAVRWLAGQSFVDRSRLYAFGHSLGGGVLELLSLHDDVPLVHSASSGSLYSRGALRSWGSRVPYNSYHRGEEDLRLLVGNIRDMQRPHWSMIGDLDAARMRGHIAAARAETRAAGHERLVIEEVAGDHMSSIRPAALRYLEVIEGWPAGRGKQPAQGLTH